MAKELPPKEVKTIDYYNNNASVWASEHMTHDFWGPMDSYYELLPDGSKVLEIGCGGGRDAGDYLTDKYDYTGTDASSGLLEVARMHNPDSKFLQQSVYDLDFPENTFDVFGQLQHYSISPKIE